ncbi:hypothetical protein GGR56DRAFT_659180 [Xylariaceae sp. FL0804]|nr:hypothetical protein GGR56DRAFT_659180 [Xylariaceae sp. FL0804]
MVELHSAYINPISHSYISSLYIILYITSRLYRKKYFPGVRRSPLRSRQVVRLRFLQHTLPSAGMPPPSGTDQEKSEMTLKEKLDRAAEDARQPASANESNEATLLGKVSEYVPGAAKVLGTGTGTGPQEETLKAGGEDQAVPPHRPDHDRQIEDFMRDQHRSKKQDGSMES